MFYDDESQFKGKSLSSLACTIDFFKKKVAKLNIVGMGQREVEQMGAFLSTVDGEGRSCITYYTVQSYFRKVELRWQYLHLADYKQLLKEVRSIKEKQSDFIRGWHSMFSKELLNYSEMRALFNKFSVVETVIDLMLIKFAEKESSTAKFFQKVDAFIEMNYFLENPEILKDDDPLTLGDKLYPDIGHASHVNYSVSNLTNRDAVTELVDTLMHYETEKSLQKGLEICKQFDKESTGLVNIGNFINILTCNMEIRKIKTPEEVESLMLKLENEFVTKLQLTTIDYSEIFDRVRMSSKVSNILSNQDSFMNVGRGEDTIISQAGAISRMSQQDPATLAMEMTKIMDLISMAIRANNFDLHRAFKLFDKDTHGVILPDDFKKVLGWTKADLSDKEKKKIMNELYYEKLIDYNKFTEMLKIHDQHIHIAFSPEIWQIRAKIMPVDLFQKINQNLENLRYILERRTRKSKNPIISAAMLEGIFGELKWDFTRDDIQET
jgi:Ca2+-binding EF-hand superfamily protein